ncbi:DUF429 domain-containing protein [Candidatus Acetothermia bacterium]|nr:DUF429 domain-containing protein [Candidatus Acetothermia bacterium]MBI3661207.1 DUF429 domain-containing protein [Candidatus Acetothermia bacterium]
MKSQKKTQPVVVGLDLAGSPKRPSGFCWLKGRDAETQELYSDEEILETISPIKPALIAIDAPLTLPRGRHCLEDDCYCAGGNHFRECDLELRRMKIRVFPLTLGPMRMLTKRGMALASKFNKMGYKTIETYPGAAQDIWKIPRQKDPKGLKKGLRQFKLNGALGKRGLSVHEMDAICCALVAQLHLQKKSLALGDPTEGLMILPKP